MTKSKIAIVTGANKGLGYAIVKLLCKKYDGKVYLTSRDKDRGIKATEDLKRLGLAPYFHQLDVTNQESLNNFIETIKNNDETVDILINNAGVFYKDFIEDRIYKTEQILKVNFFALVNFTEAILPFFVKKGGKIVNISSSSGHLSRIPSEELRSKISAGDSGYAQRPWLMTPFLDMVPGSPEAHYNEKHMAARVTIENTFGRLKNRWRCLCKDRTLHYTPAKCAQIIQACCVLHNLALDLNVPEPTDYLEDLTLDDLKTMINGYFDLIKKGLDFAKEWGDSPYVVSKVAVNCYTFLLHRRLEDRGITVNCVHPGYVISDMTNGTGTITPEDAAKIPVDLALESSTGGRYFWHNGEPVPWDGEDPRNYIDKQ